MQRHVFLHVAATPLICFVKKLLRETSEIWEAYSEHRQTSSMELFPKIATVFNDYRKSPS